jgi:hypothetical protein
MDGITPQIGITAQGNSIHLLYNSLLNIQVYYTNNRGNQSARVRYNSIMSFLVFSFLLSTAT